MRYTRQMKNDSSLALRARPDPEYAPTALPDQPPTCTRGTNRDGKLDHHGTDAAEPVAEGAGTDEGFWHTLRRQHRRKKNDKIFGSLLPVNGSLIGMERKFDLYFGECAIKTADIDVLSHNRAHSNIEAKLEALEL